MERNENIEIKRISDILKRKKIIIVFLLIIFTTVGYLYSYKYIVPEYKSTETLLLIPNKVNESETITNSDLTMNSGLISTYSNIAKNTKVLKKVIKNLELNMTEEQLLDKMEINIVKDTHIIKISVSDKDPRLARNITKELSKVFLKEIKDIYNLNNIGIVDEAQLPNNPYNINHIKDTAIFLALGIMISFGYILTIYILDNTIKKEDDIEKYIKIKALGNIPINQNKKQELIERNNAKSYITECINTIRTNILYMNSTQNAKTILITSCTPKEGKSWISANIAVSFAETNKKVLLVDADMRKGRANKIFNVDNEEGLSNFLYHITGDVKKDIELGRKYIKETAISNLHILTNGTIPPNPSELLGASSMKQLLALLKNIYDIIIIDAPPCKLVSDSIILTTMVDSTILVANAEKTKIKDLKETKKSIENVGGKIIGAIINKVKISGRTYNKSYYYGHKSSKNKSGMKKEKFITVNEVINLSLPQLKAKDYNIFFDENDISYSNLEEKEDENSRKQDFSELIKRQDNYLEKMINDVSDIKVQLKNNSMKDRLNNTTYKDNLEEAISKKISEWQEKNSEELKREIRNVNNTNELNQISNQLESVRINYDNILTQFKEKMELNNNMHQEIKEALNSKEIIKDINKNRFTKEQFKEAFREEVYNLKEQNKAYMQADYGRLVREIINSNNAKIEEMQEETKKILQQQISNINYTQQINQMSEMIENLKDSYLELANIIRTNNEQEINKNNVIDLKTVKKQKGKKDAKTKIKLVYSLDEDIAFENLEATASYIIPIKQKYDNKEVSDSYENFMY